jgi:hypothetical protein
MNVKNSILATLFALLFLFGSCQWMTSEFEVPELPDEVSFATDIQPFLTSKCAGCHNGNITLDLTAGASYNELISGGYVNTSDPASSEIVVQTNTGHGALNVSQKALLLEWITQGALNN